MDTNGTRFHLVQGSDDWSRRTKDASPTIAVGEGLSLRSRLSLSPPRAKAAVSQPSHRRRGGARDRYGNWYWVDATHARIQVRSAGSNELGVFWPRPARRTTTPGAFGAAHEVLPPPPCRFAGLVVTDDHYLIVGTLDAPGLLVFDLHSGGPPRRFAWPASISFRPYDMAPRPGGGFFVLDRPHPSEGELAASPARYWSFDRHLGVLDPSPGAPPGAEYFSAADGQLEALPTRRVPQGVELSLSSPISAADPVAIEALPDGSVLILDLQAEPRVHRYRGAEHLGSAALDLGAVLMTAEPVELGADLAFVPGGASAHRIYVPSRDGEQVYSFTVAWSDAALVVTPDDSVPFLPMRMFGGKGLVVAENRVYYDFRDEAWIPLVEQKRPRFDLEGTLTTSPFDGKEPACVWHRLFFDGCVPPTSEVEVWSRAADDEAELEHTSWSPEPRPQRRPTGSELALASIPESRSDSGTFELLFQKAMGRWLQLKFRLRGDGRSSPRLRTLRVWYPRFSYLANYLPALYREDRDSSSFLERFLANIEGLFTSVEDRMNAAQSLFDARTAPPDALDWLAGWFGVALDPAWSVAKRRLFLRHAMEFFRRRGTVKGLSTALRLVIEECAEDELFDDTLSRPASIRIVESFRLRELPPLSLGDPNPTSEIRATLSPPFWSPEQGGTVLSELYRAALVSARSDLRPDTFPVFEPTDGTAPVWRRFLRDVMSLTSTAALSDSFEWQSFLARRYTTIAALNKAWVTKFAEFSEIALPSSLPNDGAPLFDWYQFQLGGDRFVRSRSRWLPAHGRDTLRARFQQYVGTPPGSTGEFSLVPPVDANLARSWRSFADAVLGFVPSRGAREQAAWRDFLARRYRRIDAYNAAYGDARARFDDLVLPTELPVDGAPLRDWYDFYAVAFATRRFAHRFTVLLPVPAREAFAIELHRQRRELATRIIELEKPAHTVFDVKFYWAMFRVGEARLSVDTVLDRSSRAPELMPPTVLGQAFLAESRLTDTPSEREQERASLGSHVLRSRHSEENTA